METLRQEDKTNLHVKLNCDKKKQRLLIHALLSCSEINTDALALILQVPHLLIENVYNGLDYLKNEAALNLLKLFLIRFSDDIMFI